MGEDPREAQGLSPGKDAAGDGGRDGERRVHHGRPEGVQEELRGGRLAVEDSGMGEDLPEDAPTQDTKECWLKSRPRTLKRWLAGTASPAVAGSPDVDSAEL